MESCEKHPHETGAAICGRCGGAWCDNCLVYAFGNKKPPLCMSCAMFAGGVRSAATRPAMPKKLLKARLKAAKPGAPSEPAPAPEAPAAGEPAAADAGTSWDTPWWEDSSSSHEPTFAD